MSTMTSSYAFRSIKTAQNEIKQTLGRLSSGTRPLADDPVAQLLAEGLKAQASGYEAANQGLSQASSLLQVADGALASQTEDLLRMREIAVQAANGTLGATERGFLETEFNSLRDSIDFTARTANFNGQKLLDGSFVADLQVGANATDQFSVALPNTGKTSLGLNALNFDTEEDAGNAITAIDAALGAITAGRADLGAYSSRIDSTIATNSVTQENLNAAASQFTDIDYIEAIGKLSLQKIQLQASIAAFNAEDSAKKSIFDLVVSRK